MAALLMIIVFGYCFAYIAAQNMQQVTLRISQTASIDLPLHMVILGFFLLGTVASWLLQTVEFLSFFYANA